MQSELTSPFIAINRHRLSTDGEGVTTLVGFHGCPLHCVYCLNPQCLQADGVWCRMMPGELYSEVEIDDLYFMATGGGICFGGGEPLLHSDFIKAFAGIMNPDIYKAYTCKDNALVISNLQWLAANGYADKVIIRLPLIPKYNIDKDRQESRQQLEKMGFTRFDTFNYIIR